MCLPRTQEADIDDPYWEPLISTENGSPVPEVVPEVLPASAPEKEAEISPVKAKKLDFSSPKKNLDFSSPNPAVKKKKRPLPTPSSAATSSATSVLSATPPAKSPKDKRSKPSPKDKKALV